jgi:hypothetical protein
MEKALDPTAAKLVVEGPHSSETRQDKTGQDRTRQDKKQRKIESSLSLL